MLEIRNLTKSYGNSTIKAVDNLSLKLKPGEVFGFLGPNGAGKSTTIKSLVGIYPFQEGDILIDGVSIKLDPLHAKKHIGYVSDNHAVFERLTGREYVNHMANLYNADMKEAEKIARDFLKEHFDNFAFYELFMINNFDSSHYYSVRFAYQRDGYAFQDIIVVNVNYGGEIMSVKAPHFGEYYDCPVTKEQIDKTVAALGEGIEPMGVFYDDNQVLCYTYIKDGVQYYVPIYAE